MALMALVTMLLWLGCSNDEGPSDGGPADTTPPVVTGVTAIDAFHVQVVFDENVWKPAAERTNNYSIVEILPLGTPTRNTSAGVEANRPETAPPQQIDIAAAVLQSDARTVLLTTGPNMTDIAYDLLVSGVSDVNGNEMSGVSTTEFTGHNTPDVTPPSILTRSPRENATGVGTMEPVVVAFSEPMSYESVFSAFTWTSSNGDVHFSMDQLNLNEYVFSPLELLARGTTYTVTLTSAAKDWEGNSLVETSWTYVTMTSLDTTPPSLVSSVPANGATNVSTGVAITLTFSEPVNRSSLKDVAIAPAPGDGTEEWQNGDRSVSFTPDQPLVEDTQYLLVIPPGSIEDLSGNRNIGKIIIQFTTGASFPSGSIQGAVAGDILSEQASNPNGAVVLAATTSIFDDQGGDLEIVGVGDVSGDTYSILRLPDDTYHLFALLDSNHDGALDPDRGDAIGVYGADIREMDFNEDSVLVAGGAAVTDVSFPLFDPVAISGTVVYDGTLYTDILTTQGYFVGAFLDDGNFDPNNPGDPAAWANESPLSSRPEYAMNTLNSDLQPSTYYVGAYIDVDMNGVYDPDVDPSGFYRNLATGDPVSVTVENGTDAVYVNIYVEDPQTGALTFPSGTWQRPQPAKKNQLSLKGLDAKIQKILRERDPQSR
jgi:hypothetical protein